MRVSRSFIAAMVLTVASVTLAQGATAQAAERMEYTPNEQATIDLLNKFAVPAPQREALLAAAESGKAWDVYREDSGPVATEHLDIDGYGYTVARFQDGSFSAVGLQIPVDSRALASDSNPAITQCSYNTGSGYQSVSGCQIDGVWGTVIVGAIDVGYTLVDGGLDRMTDYGYGYQQCLFPTTCSSPSLVLSQDVEGGTAAHGRWQADVTASWGSWNVWVQLNVGDDSAWQSNS